MGQGAEDMDTRWARETSGNDWRRTTSPAVAPQQCGEPDDAEIEEIHEAAALAAVDGWGPAGVMSHGNPYPRGSERADIWDYAYRNAYARQNGY